MLVRSHIEVVMLVLETVRRCRCGTRSLIVNSDLVKRKKVE